MSPLMTDPDMLIQAALIFLRASALLFVLPFFGDSVVSPQVRILTGVSLTLGLYAVVPRGWAPDPSLGALAITAMMLREVLLGLVVGYCAKLIFEGLIMAANLVGYQMGFGTANLIMPGSDAQMNPFAGLHRIVVLLIFLSLGMHYVFIHALVETFRTIPAGGAVLSAPLGRQLIGLSGHVFKTAIQLAAPILVALLFTMSALGLVARTVPQMNVFTLSFPLSLFVGLVIYIGMTPFLPGWLQEHYLASARSLYEAIAGLSP